MSDHVIDEHFPISGPINLQLRIAHGSVTVDARDGITEAGVHIEADEDSRELLDQTTVEMRGSTLVVQAPRQGGIFDLAFFGVRRGKGLIVHVVLPSGSATKISTFTAPIVINGRVGDSDVASGSADVEIAEVTGDLRLRFGSGSAAAAKVSGSVQLRSGSGNAQFGEIGGDLVAGCGSGDLEVRIAHGSVRSRCGSGNARLDAVHGNVDLVSGSGGLDIGLPSGVSAQLDVLTGSGMVRSDLPVEEQPRPGAEAIKVRARTGSGDVRLFRAA